MNDALWLCIGMVFIYAWGHVLRLRCPSRIFPDNPMRGLPARSVVMKDGGCWPEWLFLINIANSTLSMKWSGMGSNGQKSFPRNFGSTGSWSRPSGSDNLQQLGLLTA